MTDEAARIFERERKYLGITPADYLRYLAEGPDEELLRSGKTRQTIYSSICLEDLSLASEYFSNSIYDLGRSDADTQRRRELCHYARIARVECSRAYIDAEFNRGCEVFYLEEITFEDPGNIHRVDRDTWAVSDQNRAVIIIENAKECEAAGYTRYHMLVDAHYDQQGAFIFALREESWIIIAEVEAERNA